ncbi:hypothetical protein ACFLX2_01430, partial [Candidatus Dependentiae bacterium]
MKLLRTFFPILFLLFFLPLCLFSSSLTKEEQNETMLVIQKLVEKIPLSAREKLKGEQFSLRRLLSVLPLLSKIKLPPLAKKFLDGIVFTKPLLIGGKDSIELRFPKPVIFGVPFRLATRI